MPHVEPPPGFAKAVGGKASQTDQHNHSPDEVLASNFGRKQNLEDGSQGQFLHTLLHIHITCSTSKPCSCILFPVWCAMEFMWILDVSPVTVGVHQDPHTLINHTTTRVPACALTKACLLAGAKMHTSQSAQRLGSSGDTSTSGRPSVDSESSSLAPGRQQQQQPLHPGMNAR